MKLRSLLSGHTGWIIPVAIVSAVAAFGQSAAPRPSTPPAAPAPAAAISASPEPEIRPVPSLPGGSAPGASYAGPAAEGGVPTPAATPPADAGKPAAEGARANPYPYEPSADKADCAICRAHLEKINEAIQAYRRDHKDLPNWLSDLYPDYLPDATVFICPVTTKTGRLSPFGPLDPKVYCSYLYEFAPVQTGWTGTMTIRDWKRQQMSLVGSDVPIVRCLLHEPAQNLSFGGRIYDSNLMWEDNFAGVVHREDLNPHDAGMPAGAIQQR